MVAGITQDAGWLILVWILGAIISLAGALCYAELCTRYPHAGGDYHFLTKAYGKDLSFLYAWAKAMVINTGAIALLAFVFGDYMSKVLSLGTYSAALWAFSIVVLLTITNIIGLQASARIQTALIVFEVLGLLAIVVAGFFAATPETVPSSAFENSPPLGLLGLAMVFVLLTFGGWNEAAYISSEVRGGPRAIVGVLVISLSVITAIYLLVNIALLWGLGLTGLAGSKTAGADVLGLLVGPWAERALGLLVAIAALTSINATMIVGARTNYALGKDWVSLKGLSQWQGARGVPITSYLVQAAISLALIVFGAFQSDGFEAMVEFTAPVFWSFLFLVGVSLFIARWRDPRGSDTTELFRVPLYPVTPLIFCLACGYLAYSSIGYAASKEAVHISLWVMFLGVAALAAVRFMGSRSARSGAA
jgi:amino acid transporter